MLNYKEPAIEDTEGVLVIYGNDYKVLQYIKFDSDFNNLITSLQMDDYTELYFDIMKFMHSLHIEPKFCSEDYFGQSYINFDDSFIRKYVNKHDLANFYCLNEETMYLLNKYISTDAIDKAIEVMIREFTDSKLNADYISLHRLFPIDNFVTMYENQILTQTRIISYLQIISKALDRKIDIPKEYLIQKKGE